MSDQWCVGPMTCNRGRGLVLWALCNILLDIVTETTAVIITTAEVQATTVAEVTSQLPEMTTEAAEVTTEKLVEVQTAGEA